MRAVGVLLLILTGAATLTALAFGVMTAGTFHESYTLHLQEREQALEYMKAPHCRRGSSARAKLGKHQLCDRSERILAGSPLWFALLDVSHTVPPMIASVANGARQDMFRVVFTVIGIGILWSWVRRYTGMQAQQWTQGLDAGMATSMAVVHEDDYIEPVWGYKAGNLPRWQPRRRRLSNL